MRIRNIAILSLLFFTPLNSLFAAEKLTSEEAEIIALQRVPGEIIEEDIAKSASTYVYEYEIRKEDETVIELEIDAYTGKTVEYRIISLGPGSILPDARVPHYKAKEIAIKYTNSMSKHGKSAEVSEIRYTVYKGVPAYEIELIKFFKEYKLYVDAMNGDVLSAKKR